MKKTFNVLILVMAALCGALFIMAIVGNNPMTFAIGFCGMLITSLLWIFLDWFIKEPIEQ